VDDLPGLGVRLGVVLLRLERRERDERVARELGPEEERLQARDQRVPSEHGHEPRHARGEELPVGRFVVEAERREVGDRAVERGDERIPRRA